MKNVNVFLPAVAIILVTWWLSFLNDPEPPSFAEQQQQAQQQAQQARHGLEAAQLRMRMFQAGRADLERAYYLEAMSWGMDAESAKLEAVDQVRSDQAFIEHELSFWRDQLHESP